MIYIIVSLASYSFERSFDLYHNKQGGEAHSPPEWTDASVDTGSPPR